MTDEELELDERDHAVVAAVRALGTPGGAPDWAALEASIQAATTRAPRGRRRYLVGAAIGVAALAAGLAFYLTRPTGPLALPSVSIVAPAVDDAQLDDEPLDEIAVDDDDGDELDSDLGAMGAIDDALADEVIELEAAADDLADESDDLPVIGAAWTAWLDDFSDDDLDRAMQWLDTQEAT